VPVGSQATVASATAENKTADQAVVEKPDAEVPVVEAPIVETWPALPMYPTMKLKMAADAASPDADGTNAAPLAEKKYQVDSIVVNQQSRRMRSHEIHYIDHPKFGILVSLIPLDKNTLQPIPRVQP